MSRFLVFPYKTGSEGATAIRDALDGQLIRRSGSQYQHRDGDCVINWGAGDCPYPFALNADVSMCINKLKFFERMQGQGVTPLYVTDRGNIHLLQFPVFCRTRVEGADGAGVVIAETPDQLVDARLYVEGIDKTAEYRIHMGRLPDGTIKMLGAQKKLHHGCDELDPRVWTGNSVTLIWNLNRAGPVIDNLPTPVDTVTYRAMELMPELAFAGLDVIYHQPTNRAYVVEANSAPMQTPRTSEIYADFFREYAEQQRAPVVQPVQEYEPSEGDIDGLLNDLFTHQVTSREVMVGYLKWINEERS